MRVKYGKIEKEGRGEKEKSKKGYGETHEFCYTGCPKVSGGQCKKKKKIMSLSRFLAKQIVKIES